MGFHGVCLVLAAVVTAVVSADIATFPEVARGLSSSRIVSGWEAKENQFPFQLSLRMVSGSGGVSSCGATIIHAEWGLTAAHCTATRVTLVVRAGLVSLTRPTYIFETTRYYNHPLYDESRPALVQPHDIGVIAFGKTLQFNDKIQPIRLQRSDVKNRNYALEKLTASGWGRTWTAPLGVAPENLNWVYLSGVSNLECFFAFGNIVEDSTICARGYNDTTQSTCQGDSGGPLTAIDDDGLITQVGVTSFVSGFGCHADMPAGFIRPGHYHHWFSEVTGENFDWSWSPEDNTTESPITWEPEGEEEGEEGVEEGVEEEFKVVHMF